MSHFQTFLTVTVVFFQCFPTTKNEEIFSWLHVKFGIKTLIWWKLTKISPTEDLLVTVIIFLARSKVFRFHAILHDSAGAVKATTNQRPGYCYMLPQIPSSCLFLGSPYWSVLLYLYKNLSSTYFQNASLLIIF